MPVTRRQRAAAAARRPESSLSPPPDSQPSSPDTSPSPSPKKRAPPRSKAAAKSTAPRGGKRAADASDRPSAASLLQDSTETTDEWYKAARTKKGYANYVKSAKKWLVEWTADEHLDGEISADVFDVISEQTPVALRALTAFKCEHMGLGFASAEGIRSAFKDYFERVCGCQGDFWRYNSHTQKWEGNPVFETGFKTYYESLKNRHNRTSTATQALPMLPADLKIIMAYLDSPEATEHLSLTKRLYFKAFATTAFTLWTRNDELVNLQFKHVKLEQRSATGIPYHEFSLIFRKTNKDPNKVQKYNVPLDLVHPEIDCYTHVATWKVHMEHILHRPLTGADYVFPAIASTGQIKFGEPTNRSTFETLLDTIVAQSNVLRGRNGRFTTHCFRRGGAQYRFLWAERKWSLKAVKWWGGWSSNDNVGTLMRYLLDELMAYEEGFSDIMMDDRLVDRHETFMGENESMPISRTDLSRFEAQILGSIRQMAIASPSTLAAVSTGPRSTTPENSPSSAEIAPLPTPTSTSSAPTVQPGRIPMTQTLDDALRYWNHGASEKGLDVPLKDWSVLFTSAQYASEAVKLGNIRFVCEEFYNHSAGDFDAFEVKFPGLRKKFTALRIAVQKARLERGETKSRKSRK
ncbi:hypothetical protein C8F01DRAFT_1377498 [Mycena amicta]|nr:hypothetical protein C8F01DRAFT_1377498 [Mycena amicta]